MNFTIEFEGFVVGPDGKPSRTLEQHLDDVMTELLKLKVADASIGATERDGSVEITVTIDADGLDQALIDGSSAIRAAIHAAGGATPNWSIDWCNVSGRKTELVGA